MTLLVTGRKLKPAEAAGFAGAGAEVLEMPSVKGCINMKRLFKTLGERGITSVLVEGGSILIGSIFDSRLADRIIAFIAPIVIGGEKAKTAVSGKGINKVINSFKLKRVDIKQFGQDIMISGYITARD
jgi:diaminohydroxyphosphoribosylaminopyrimidine deaminase/5-amino-6-(5-phosphoribosylamino)uracil reductase